MGIYEELQARGLIAQVTNESEIRDLVNSGNAKFYIGFDPTADSLHVGHFMALCLMKRLQMAGNKPVVLIGGGTGYVGDPSGRTDMRSMMTPETIQHNCDCFKKQMERFIEFGEGKAIMVNNADWLLKLNYIDLLREVGACFSVNNMLRAECYKQRMAKGLSFLEFRLQYAVRRRRPVVQYAVRDRPDPEKTGQNRCLCHDDHFVDELRRQKDGENGKRRGMARSGKNVAL